MIDLLEYFIPIYALGSFVVLFLVFDFYLSVLPFITVIVSILNVIMPSQSLNKYFFRIDPPIEDELYSKNYINFELTFD